VFSTKPAWKASFAAGFVFGHGVNYIAARQNAQTGRNTRITLLFDNKKTLCLRVFVVAKNDCIRAGFVGRIVTTDDTDLHRLTLLKREVIPAYGMRGQARQNVIRRRFKLWRTRVVDSPPVRDAKRRKAAKQINYGTMKKKVAVRNFSRR